MNPRLEKIARTGYLAKGIVYAIAGALTFLAAFDLGGQKTDQSRVLEFLARQPFGNALLLLLSLGMACYALWRFTQTFHDPEGIGSDKKGTFKRTAFFLSGCSYLGLGYLAVMQISGNGSSGGSDMSSSIPATTTGLVLLGILGGVFAGRGIYQFIRIHRSSFTRKFNWKSVRNEKRRKAIKNAAILGMMSRGILFLVIGYFALRAALTSDPSEMKSTAEAFSFIEDSVFGAWLLGLIAAGFVGYGIYMFMTAKYRAFDT